MMNNPFPALLEVARSGGDIKAAVRKMGGNNPMIKQFFDIVRNKNPAQLRQVAENMAKERGISINDVLAQLGVTNASMR